MYFLYFILLYHEGPQHGCGGILNQTNGQITSFDADGDGNYENYLDCRWTIYVGPNMLVTLNITNMDLEFGADCIYDYLAVCIYVLLFLFFI